MSASCDHLDAFAAALQDPGRPPPPGLATWNRSDPAARFAVYRNNVVVSLTEALADTFPVTRQHVGSRLFDVLARCFIDAEPPRSAVLTDYGDGFPAFVAGWVPTANRPWLSDLALLERQRVRAYHAADADALDANALAIHLADQERLPGARLQLHPALATVSSRYAICSLWAAHHDEAPVDPVQLTPGESALILRQGDQVLVLRIAVGTAAFIAALASRATLAEAVTAAGAADPAFDLVEALTLLIRHGGIAAWHSPGDR